LRLNARDEDAVRLPLRRAERLGEEVVEAKVAGPAAGTTKRPGGGKKAAPGA
jgi:hypothetical protein